MAKIALCLFAALSARALAQYEDSRFYKSAGCSGTPTYVQVTAAQCESDGSGRYRTFTCNGTTTEFYTYDTAGCTGNATFSHRREASSCESLTGGTVWSKYECASTTTTTTTTTGATVRVRIYNDSACSSLTSTSQSPWRLGCHSTEHPRSDSNGTYSWAGSSSHGAQSGNVVTSKQYDVVDCPATATPTRTDTITCGACVTQSGGGARIIDECPSATASFAQKSTTTTYVTVLLGAALLLQK